MPAAQQPRLTRPFRRSLRLVSRYASLRLASGPVPQPACWRVLRVDWPQAQPSQQLTTQPQPIQQPAQAQLSPASRSPRRNQHHNPAAQHHPWLRSLVAETSFSPKPTSNPPKPTPPKPLSLSSAETGPHQPGLNQRLAQPSPPAGQACLTCLRPSPAIARPPQCGCPARRKLASAQPTTHASKVQPSCPRLASSPAQAYLMCLRLACGPAQPGEAGLSDLSGASFRYSDLPNTGFRCS